MKLLYTLIFLLLSCSLVLTNYSFLSFIGLDHFWYKINEGKYYHSIKKSLTLNDNKIVEVGTVSRKSFDLLLQIKNEFEEIQWTKVYGGIKDDGASSLIKTMEGGYMIVGYTESFGNGNQDIWLLKTDSLGNKLWDKTYGGKENDYGRTIIQTNDGDYMICGETYSFDDSEWGDIWIVKTDSSGNEEWEKSYGGESTEICNDIIEKEDGYIVSGSSRSFNDDGVLLDWKLQINTRGVQENQ